MLHLFISSPLALPSAPTLSSIRGRGNPISGKVNGSLVAGHSQEPLAPRSVDFFPQERKRLGDKTFLKQQIHEITAIPKSALQGAPLSQFSVNERLSWIEHRQTKLEEDKAYSLLGIFDIYITPYLWRRDGEGV